MIGQDLHTVFREHFSAAYGTEHQDYAQFESYYMFGYDQALDGDYEGLDFAAAEEDLRAAYAQQYPNSDFDTGSAAIQFGFEQGLEEREA